MEFEAVMQELERLGNERMARIYTTNGAHPPLFGVATGAMRGMARKIRRNQPLAEQLYATGNYDAMYFAGVIADPDVMTEADFDRWMDGAYFYMLSDFVVAVSLAETSFAQAVADRWIGSGEELRMSAGWSCYAWLLGNRKDAEFDTAKLQSMLAQVTSTIHAQPNRTRYAMINFLIALGTSYIPLHEAALIAAQSIGEVKCTNAKGPCAVPSAHETIRKAAEQGRIGFKRKAVRC